MLSLILSADSLASIFEAAGIQDIRHYFYWDAKQRDVCVEKLLADLEQAPEQSVVVLSASAHWPTGADLSEQHWALITQLMMVTCICPLLRKNNFVFIRLGLHCLPHHPSPILLPSQQRRRLFPFILLPVQGLCCGDLQRDAWPVQHCASQGMELLCAQSFSHCFGLYGEKVMFKRNTVQCKGLMYVTYAAQENL